MITPSGTQYVAWTTASERGPRTVRLARRPEGGDWLPSRVVARRAEQARPQRALELRWSNRGAYLAWVQPIRTGGARIRGALVRSGRRVDAQSIAGPRATGGRAPSHLAVDLARGGRLLVAWTARKRGRWVVTAALGRELTAPRTTRLFDVDAARAPVAVLRRSSEATVIATAPSTLDGDGLRSASTD